MKNYSTGGARIQCHPNGKTSAGQHLTDAVLFHTGAPEGAFQMKGARNGTCGEASHLEAKKEHKGKLTAQECAAQAKPGVFMIAEKERDL